MRKIINVLVWLLASSMSFTACAQSKTSKEQTKMENKKVLVAFFSRTGENYAVGNISKGNTHIVAEMIAEKTGGKLFQIEPVNPYPDNYDDCVELAKQEMNAKKRPAIKSDVPVEDYDVIFIGYPNWWGDMPMPVYTFIEKHNWQGKTIIPFCTHEGSGMGSTAGKLQQACKGATAQKGLAMFGHTAQNSREEARTTVADWLKELKF